jgi:hypothetical protein
MLRPARHSCARCSPIATRKSHRMQRMHSGCFTTRRVCRHCPLLSIRTLRPRARQRGHLVKSVRPHAMRSCRRLAHPARMKRGRFNSFLPRQSYGRFLFRPFVLTRRCWTSRRYSTPHRMPSRACVLRQAYVISLLSPQRRCLSPTRQESRPQESALPNFLAGRQSDGRCVRAAGRWKRASTCRDCPRSRKTGSW